MKLLLTATAAIAAGSFPGVDADIAAQQAFEMEPDVAQPLLAAGVATLATSAPTQPPAPAPKRKASAARIPVRVLVTCDVGAVNDVVELDAGEAQARAAAGQVDPHPDAVAYARSLAA